MFGITLIWRRWLSKLGLASCLAVSQVSVIKYYTLTALAQGTTINPIVETLPDAQELDEQGRAFYDAGEFDAAVKVWQKAAATFEDLGDKLRQAMTLSNLSLAYQQLGEWTLATESVEESLNLLDSEYRQNDSSDRMKILAQALDVQGRLQLAKGQAKAAQNTWQQAAEIYILVGDDAGVTRSSINSAIALRSLGLYRRALKTLEEVEETLQNQPDSLLKAAGLRNLGNILRVFGNLDKSQQVLQQSRQIAQRWQSSQDIGAALFSLGNTARAMYDQAQALEKEQEAQHQAQEALTFYQQAATLSTSPTTKLQAQLNQLSLLVDTEQFSATRSLLPQIQSQLLNLPPSRTVVYGWINLAQSLMKMKRGADRGNVTLPSVAQILANAIQQAKSLGDRRAQSYALGHLGELYEVNGQWSEAIAFTQQALQEATNSPEIAYKWQWQLGRLLKEQGNREEAIAAYSEAYNHLQSLRHDLVAINPDVQFSFREEVEPVYRQLVDLLLQPQGNLEPTQENLGQARQVIESLQLAELDNFFREACLDAKVDIDQVIDQEDPTAAAIYPIILENRLEVIFKLPNQPLRHYTTPISQSQVERTLDELWYNLTQPDTLRKAQSLSQQVYNWLIQPVEKDLAQSEIQTLVFVLDGSLRNIPMAALYDGQQYLVEKYSIAITPGLQLFDPKPLGKEQLNALTAGLTEPRHGFPPLNNVDDELKQIQSEIPSHLLLNQQFTTEALQDQMSQPFPVVHLATHGQFSSNAEETFILAWDEPIKVNDLDTLLQTGNPNSSNVIELLVLSACETAAGDKRATLGLAGVAVRAGARSTLASLWSVDDESTALLMSQFYKELANNQLTKAEALRRAQLALLKHPQYQRPLFWSPYVLLGNWL
ncbi:MAG: CHAT domain-containing protein [Coleofasciculaceae cyanobacterium]